MNMENSINWNFIALALDYKMQQIGEKIYICKSLKEYSHELKNAEEELEIYKKEYRKVLIEQQKSNKNNDECELFSMICPKCNSNGDEMSYRRIKKKELLITYICPYCGHSEVRERFMYE